MVISWLTKHKLINDKKNNNNNKILLHYNFFLNYLDWIKSLFTTTSESIGVSVSEDMHI